MCVHCGSIHFGTCNRIKSIHFLDGSIISVEYWEHWIQYPMAIMQEDVYE